MSRLLEMASTNSLVSLVCAGTRRTPPRESAMRETGVPKGAMHGMGALMRITSVSALLQARSSRTYSHLHFHFRQLACCGAADRAGED